VAPSRKDQLLGRAFDHIIAAEVIGAVYVGDRLGLFKAMAGAGPLTADRLAEKTGTNTRYVLEWLRSMATSRYVDYHPQDGTFELPADFVPVLVDENSPEFVCGIVEGVYPDFAMIPRVLEAARTGRGISYGDYPPETFDAIERTTKQDYLHRLVPEWLPAIPGITERLRAGGTAADLGSGSGWASIEIAKAFPAARTFGYEPYAPSVERARKNAADAKVADRVTFSTFDGVRVPGGPYDLVTINYSLHHAGDPVALMRSAREVLAPGGAFLIVEFRKSARLEDDIDSMRRVFYPIGLLECMPAALAEGGPGYGTGISEPDVRKLAEQAGFRDVRRVLPDDELKAFFVLRA
jgi:SAM-dependent methyltransferase